MVQYVVGEITQPEYVRRCSGTRLVQPGEALNDPPDRPRSLQVHIPLTRTPRTKRTEDGAHLHAVRCSCGRAVRRFPRARPGPGTRSEFATLAVLCQIGRASCRV